MKTLIASISLVTLCLLPAVANARATIEDARGTRTLWLYLSADNDMLGDGGDWVGRHPEARNRRNAALYYDSEEACLGMKNYGLDRGLVPNLINLCVPIEVPTTYTKEELEAYFLLKNKPATSSLRKQIERRLAEKRRRMDEQ